MRLTEKHIAAKYAQAGGIIFPRSRVNALNAERRWPD
jgi:hypothetical protein